MTTDYLDTSALAKHYHSEAGSAEVDQLWNEPTHGLVVSSLSAVEIISVFAGKLRAGSIAQSDFDLLRKRFAADLTKTKRLIGIRLLVGHYREAEQLLRRHGPARRLRTLDALQLAVACDLYKYNEIDRFVSADKDLLVVAALEGLNVFNPENS